MGLIHRNSEVPDEWSGTDERDEPDMARRIDLETMRRADRLIENAHEERKTMGVMACGRRDCENIMCTRLILDHSAYICDECFEELLLRMGLSKERDSEIHAGLPERMCPVELRRRIEDFMRTPKGTFLEVDTREEFDRLTGGR